MSPSVIPLNFVSLKEFEFHRNSCELIPSTEQHTSAEALNPSLKSVKRLKGRMKKHFGRCHGWVP